MFQDIQNKPPAGSRIDWSNPITNALMFSCEFLEGSGTPVDLVSGTKATGTGTWTPSIRGLSTSFNGTSDNWSFANQPQWQIGQSSMTYFILANPISEATVRDGCGKRDPAGNNQSLLMRFNQNSSNSTDAGKMFFGIRDNTTSNLWCSSQNSVIDGNYHIFCATLLNISASVGKQYLDGVAIPTTNYGINVQVNYTGTDPIIVGSTAANYYQKNVVFARMWKRVLSDGEISALALSPYSYLTTQIKAPRISFFSSGHLFPINMEGGVTV